jgi:hypothetical protein
MSKKSKIGWLKEPAQADYEAAPEFLSLIYSSRRSKSLVRALRSSPLLWL